MTAPSAHGHRLGRASPSAMAPTCRAAEALSRGAGVQRAARMAIYSPRVRRGGGGVRLSAAEKTSAKNAPGATVDPSAANTGTCENARTPNPTTVVALAIKSDARVSGAVPAY